MKVLELAPAFACLPNPSIALDPDAVMPTELPGRHPHQLGMNKASIREQDYFYVFRQSFGRLS
jgi:hypothetical protein